MKAAIFSNKLSMISLFRLTLSSLKIDEIALTLVIARSIY
jgi:hypothetical protein